MTIHLINNKPDPKIPVPPNVIKLLSTHPKFIREKKPGYKMYLHVCPICGNWRIEKEQTHIDDTPEVSTYVPCNVCHQMLMKAGPLADWIIRMIDYQVRLCASK